MGYHHNLLVYKDGLVQGRRDSHMSERPLLRRCGC